MEGAPPALSLAEHVKDHAAADGWWASFLERFHPRPDNRPNLTIRRRDLLAAVHAAMRQSYAAHGRDDLWAGVLEQLATDAWYAPHTAAGRLEVIFGGVNQAEKIDALLQAAVARLDDERRRRRRIAEIEAAAATRGPEELPAPPEVAAENIARMKELLNRTVEHVSLPTEPQTAEG